MPHQINIDLTSAGDLDVSPDEKVCKVSEDDEVRWTCNKPHWLAIFGPDAPIHPKVAGPGRDTVRLMTGRPGDFADIKYTLAIWTGSELKDSDPKLIVRP